MFRCSAVVVQVVPQGDAWAQEPQAQVQEPQVWEPQVQEQEPLVQEQGQPQPLVRTGVEPPVLRAEWKQAWLLDDLQELAFVLARQKFPRVKRC